MRDKQQPWTYEEQMVAPLDVYPVIHNGFRRDLTEIDEAVYKVARHGGDLSPLIDRLYLFSQILDRHAQGEDEYIGWNRTKVHKVSQARESVKYDFKPTFAVHI